MDEIRLAGVNLTEEESKAIAECEFEIVDVHKFLEFLKLKKQSDKLRKITTSTGEKMDLCKPKHFTVADILDLPDDEQKKILTRQENFRKIHTVCLNTRRAAYGGYGTERTKLNDSLLSDRKSEILEYFGRMFSVKEVMVILKNDLGFKTITEKVIANFHRDNIDEIKRLQEKHKQDYTHLRLTSKTSRLEELTYLYGKLKRRYEITNNREDHKALLTTMESIRKEVEGDKLTLQGNIGIQVQQEVNLHVRAELMKGVALKEVILGRLSAKTGINATKILSSLNDSYYSKWNRLINSNADDVEYEDIPLPSTQSYDFEKIQVVNDDREKIEKIALEKEKSEKEERQNDKSEKDRIKEIMLEKLRKGNSEAIQKSNSVQKKLM